MLISALHVVADCASHCCTGVPFWRWRGRDLEPSNARSARTVDPPATPDVEIGTARGSARGAVVGFPVRAIRKQEEPPGSAIGP